jgi:hypothetical protein
MEHFAKLGTQANREKHHSRDLLPEKRADTKKKEQGGEALL